MTELIDPQNELNKNLENLPVVRNPEFRQSGEDLFTVIAHDLRDPISSIKMLSGFIREELRKKNHAEVVTLIDLLYNQVEHTEHLLNDLLAWGKARTNKVPFQPAALQIAEVFNELLTLYAVRIREKAIILDICVSGKLMIIADPMMLNTILRNVFTNAIKFSFPHGKISLSAYTQSGAVIIQVQDEGRGIPPSELNKILHDAPMISTPGTNNETGTGLGLQICKEYLKIHHGTIRIDSEPDRGTLITLTFPNPFTIQ